MKKWISRVFIFNFAATLNIEKLIYLIFVIKVEFEIYKLIW